MSELKDVEMNKDEVKEIDNVAKDIEDSFLLLHEVSTTFDNRYITKLFRGLGLLRRKLKEDGTPLFSVLSKAYKSVPSKSYIFSFIPETASDSQEETKIELLPEIDLYLHLLLQIYLLDTEALTKLDEFNDKIIQLMKVYNRRSLDFIQAKIWFYISRTKELINDLYSIRPEMLYALRTATLRHDIESVSSIITILLRNYLLTKDIEQALNLVEKTEFPDNASTSLGARYYYYLAKIHSIQLDYSSANDCCISAIRKAPQTKFSAGFIQSATKLQIVIELLMGDIPTLKVFKTKDWNLEPYFMVTRAVKSGDVKMFDQVLSNYKNDFIKDDNYNLISRLHQNVIKTGIRIISLSYSKISLKDICIKLHLDSEELTEYIVAKAIRDGVIEASINHEKGFMQSKELIDIYSTKAPQDEYDQRIRFCLSLYNDSVKAMRFPSDNLKELNKPQETLEDEFDLLSAIQEGDLDDFMD